MFPYEEYRAFKEACDRGNYSLYFMASRNSSSPPIHSGMSDDQLNLLSGFVSHLWGGGEESTSGFSLVEPPPEALLESFEYR